MDDWPVHSSFALTALSSAAFWARRHTEEVLRKWDLPAELAETAVLVVSELVANAAKATATALDERERRLYDQKPIALPYQRAALGVVRLTVSCDYRRVLVEVSDEAPGIPARGNPADDEECGRGLILVDSLCGRWGWYPVVGNGDPGRPQGKGKVVWGLLCPSGPRGMHP